MGLSRLKSTALTLTKEAIEHAKKIIKDGHEQGLIDDDIDDLEEGLEDLLFHLGGKTIVEMIKENCEPGRDYFRYPCENAGDDKYFEDIESVNEAFITDILANYDNIYWKNWNEFDDEGLLSWCDTLSEISEIKKTARESC
jgi:hypothetical protein